MHTRFTKRVENVVQLACTIAREYELDYVGTEHILLAIRREGTGVGSHVLEDRGITEAQLKAEIDRRTKESLEDTWVFGRLPGTPNFRAVVTEAIGQAERMGSESVCTEHLLLALLKEEGCVASETLKTLGCTFDGIRTAVVERTSK